MSLYAFRGAHVGFFGFLAVRQQTTECENVVTPNVEAQAKTFEDKDEVRPLNEPTKGEFAALV